MTAGIKIKQTIAQTDKIAWKVVITNQTQQHAQML